MDQPVAIITGAGRGIGRETALELARRGYDLVVAARNSSEIEQTLQLASIDERRGVAISTDVAKFEEVDRLIAKTVGRFGRIDALIHCAGVAPVVKIKEMTIEDWHTVLDTNLSAAFYLCRAAWPTFERQRRGTVVNVSSVAARDPFPGFAAYGAAKAGLQLFGLSAAREGEAIGVRVHTVAPSAVETRMFRNLMTPEQYPSEKTLDPHDVAMVIADCVTGALRYTSGETIHVHKTM